MIIKALIDKLKVVCRYCEENAGARAAAGMRDIMGVLSETVTQVLDYKTKHPASGADEVALIGSLQLVLDGIAKSDAPSLNAALKEGLIPELERIRSDSVMSEVVEARVEAGAQSGGGFTGISPEEESTAGKRLEAAAVVCLFGYGDGSFYEKLCGQAPEGAVFIVYEPETDTIVDLRDQLQEQVDFYKLEGLRVLVTPGYRQIFATEYTDFVQAIRDNRERILVNKNTLKRFKGDASKNVITNLGILRRCNLVSDLARILPREVPVIIVSAGPSLDKNIELLKEAKGHSLIFAVDTAMKYLMQHDIMPDLAITVEPIKPMANYADERCFDVPHVFDCESNPEIVSKERERIFIYNCRDYSRRLLESVGVEVPHDIASGGSVATAAFAICYQLQMKTIVMIGQDLAYSGTSTHAGGVESAGINGDIGYETVDGIDGKQVRTRSDWLGYLRWFENGIRTIREQKLDITVVDATEGGALIHGSRAMTLRDAIDRYCLRGGEEPCEYDFAKELERLPYMLDEEDIAAFDETVNKSFEELKEVRRAALEAAGLCEEAIEQAGAAEKLSELRRVCESALMYPLINNYAVSDIADEVSRLRQNTADPVSEYRQQKLAFDAIADACVYFEGLRDA